MYQVRVKPGESALAFYTAENKSSTPITGVSTYNVTPMKVLTTDEYSVLFITNDVRELSYFRILEVYNMNITMIKTLAYG